MKKLKLNLGFVSEQLSKEQMKQINGGFGGYCYQDCSGYGTDTPNCPKGPNNQCDSCFQTWDESGYCLN